MRKKLIGIGLGTVAGILDVVPMILQNLTWDANISAFSMWLIIGLILASVDFKLHSILKGILVAFLILLPVAILIAWKEPFSLIPIAIMTSILGAGLGYSVERLGKTAGPNRNFF